MSCSLSIRGVLQKPEKRGIGDNLLVPLFVSIDPFRDTVARVRVYVQGTSLLFFQYLICLLTFLWSFFKLHRVSSKVARSHWYTTTGSGYDTFMEVGIGK